MTLFKLFLIFFRIGLLTIGGGYVILPVIEKELVSRRNWISERDFHQIFTVVQGLPGPLAVNCSTMVGYRLAGVSGAFVSALGSVLPSFIVITTIALFFADFSSWPVVQRFFLGVRPAVLSLILYYGLRMMRRSPWTLWRLGLFAVFFALFVLYRPNPVYLILAGIGIGLMTARLRSQP